MEYCPSHLQMYKLIPAICQLLVTHTNNLQHEIYNVSPENHKNEMNQFNHGTFEMVIDLEDNLVSVHCSPKICR